MSGTSALGRHEFETLCLLDAIGAGCQVADLPPRLGLSSTLVEIVADALDELVESGLVERDGAEVGLTTTGQARLNMS